jgi:hypothetical protein
VIKQVCHDDQFQFMEFTIVFYRFCVYPVKTKAGGRIARRIENLELPQRLHLRLRIGDSHDFCVFWDSGEGGLFLQKWSPPEKFMAGTIACTVALRRTTLAPAHCG